MRFAAATAAAKQKNNAYTQYTYTCTCNNNKQILFIYIYIYIYIAHKRNLLPPNHHSIPTRAILKVFDFLIPLQHFAHVVFHDTQDLHVRVCVCRGG